MRAFGGGTASVPLAPVLRRERGHGPARCFAGSGRTRPLPRETFAQQTRSAALAAVGCRGPRFGYSRNRGGRQKAVSRNGASGGLGPRYSAAQTHGRPVTRGACRRSATDGGLAWYSTANVTVAAGGPWATWTASSSTSMFASRPRRPAVANLLRGRGGGGGGANERSCQVQFFAFLGGVELANCRERQKF